MNKKSRTKNVTKNASIGLITQILTVFLEFAVRTVLIKKLGSEYLGVNGLFTNILTILSFAELGIGNAIIFSMYKEIANNNIEKIKSLMILYKKAYKIIGFVVLFIGISITPFLKLIINGNTNIKENIYLIYILFLLNTVASYFFAYKKSIIQAYQKGYIVNICKLISEILKSILQIIILFVLKNFIVFLIIQILCTIIDNLLASNRANYMFDFLKDKKNNELEQSEKNNIFSNVKALILYKFGSVVLNGTDNIIISKMLGLVSVGIISNYNLLINTINQLISSVLNGFTASIGNLNANNDKQKQEKILKELLFICVWIYGFCAIAFLILSKDFINLWIGKEYQLPLFTVLALVLHIYVNGVQFAGYTYRTTLGLFEKGKLCPIIAAILNVFLSITLCFKLGLTGIIIATSISRLLTTTWYDIFLIYKYQFKKSPYNFFIKYLTYLIAIFFIGLSSYWLIDLIKFNGIIGFIIKSVLCIIIINLLFIGLFANTYEFKTFIKKVRCIIWKKKAI